MYNSDLPLIRGLEGAFEAIIDTGEVLNMTSNPRLATWRARLTCLCPALTALSRPVHSAVELLARMIIQLDADTPPFTV